MQIDLRDRNRQFLFRVEVDHAHPPAVVRGPQADGEGGAEGGAEGGGEGGEVYLNWEKAFDDHGRLRHCPVCGCRETFVRKDFPQVTGFVLVVLVAVIAVLLFAADQVLWAVTVLGVVVLVDFAIYFFTGKCLVCYRCRSEFRGMPIHPRHPSWELAIGEKYRLQPGSASPPPPEATSTDDKASAGHVAGASGGEQAK